MGVSSISSFRSNFLVVLQEELGDDGFEHFQSLDSFHTSTVFLLGSKASAMTYLTHYFNGVALSDSSLVFEL